MNGCTDPAAMNYDSEATEDNGSCVPVGKGCNTPGACNYDPDVNVDDGSCESTSCLDAPFRLLAILIQRPPKTTAREFLSCLGLDAPLVRAIDPAALIGTILATSLLALGA